MKSFFALLFLLMSVVATAQTLTTQALDKKYGGLKLYFYKNTLRMLNQNGDKSFDELVKDIDKMKFMMFDKTDTHFSDADYQKLKTDYRTESYEEMITSRIQGKLFDVYVREVNGSVKGTIILASDATNLYVLDIVGRVALDKVPMLFETLNETTDIGSRIREFIGNGPK